MNKKHLFIIIILSIVYYCIFNFVASVFISLAMVSFLYTATGICKSRNCVKATNYFAIGFTAAVISLFTDIKFILNNNFNFEIVLTGILTIFCGTMCYMIFVDETDAYRLNLKYSKIKLFSFTGVILGLYLVMF